MNFIMKLTRRDFARASAGLPLLAGMSRELSPDVVVVGAGVAGMAAARVLRDAGRRVQVFEAAPRIGGRCYTDTASFGLPFDQGAMWLRRADFNPLYGFAQLYRFTTSLPQPREILFAGGRRLNSLQNASFDRAIDAYSLALADAAEGETDMAAGSVSPSTLSLLPPADRAWLATAAARIGPLDLGLDLDQISVKDWAYRHETEPSRLVREGLGTLAGRLSEGLAISVGTAVQQIRALPGGQVDVVTTRGRVRARAVIVTVSVGVLAAGSIGFDPQLPSEHQAAIGGLQMGSTLRIGLSFAAGSKALSFPDNSLLLQQVDDQRAAEFLVRPFGAPMLVCSVGGSLAMDLEPRGERTHVAFALEALRSMIGSEASMGLTGNASSRWGRNPLILGSVASARPGHMRARDALRQPVHENIHLAGEALGDKAIQTVNGAYDSGQRAARRVASALRRAGI
jgi:monoamine oxidase